MRFKPVNPNGAHASAHAIIMGCTGSGKSQLLRTQVPIAPTTRVVGYDDVGAVPGLYYSDRAKFLQALRVGISRGRGFRVFYAGRQTVADYCWWAEVVWSILDGRYITHVVTEEMAAISPGPGEAPEIVGLLMNQGRKYGMRHIGTTQRPEEVSKTFYTQSRIKYVGQQSDPDSVRKMAKVAAVTQEQILALQPLQFYLNEGTAGGGRLVTVPYREASGVIWKD